MSSIDQPTDLPKSNFVSIFDAASNEYRKVTKNDLHTHQFAARLDNCDSPDAVLNVFRMQAKDFDEFCKGDGRLMKWLDPIVNILFTLSATIGEGIGLVRVFTYSLSLCLNVVISAICACKNNIYRYRCSPRGISLLKSLDVRLCNIFLQAAKDIITAHCLLVNLFERVQMFLQRLGIYIGIPLTEAMTELLGKIMAQVISILALSTKAMTQGRISK
jgi:hypothetical protein